MSLNTTPRTWTASEIVTAAQMNTEVRDALVGMQAAWTAYTPVWTAVTTNPALGNGTLVGSWCRFGKSVLGWRVVLTIGSTTTLGVGQWSLTAPGAGVASVLVASLVTHVDTGVASRAGSHLLAAGSATGQLLAPGATAGGADRPVGATDPHAWGTGDQLIITGSPYELA